MNGNTKAVLIVEDEDSIRNLLAGVLSPRYKVFQAANAERALEIMLPGGGRLDLLLTDVVMPGMDGFALADRLRLKNPELQIVFISGYFSTLEFQSRVLKYGAQFLRKPFSIPSLLSVVDRVLAPEPDADYWP